MTFDTKLFFQVPISFLSAYNFHAKVAGIFFHAGALFCGESDLLEVVTAHILDFFCNIK